MSRATAGGGRVASRQCGEIVLIRDTYRYSGRGKGGFTMHYIRQQCHRRTVAENGLCWQHQPDYHTKRWQAEMAARTRSDGGQEDGEG